MRIQADHPRLQYSGRIDFTDPRAPVFVFPCTYVRIRFTGSILKAYVKNHRAYWNNYIGCIIDGKQVSYRLPDEGEAVLNILPGQACDAGPDAVLEIQPGQACDAGPDMENCLQQAVHEVMLFKRQDACHEITFCGFEAAEDAQLLAPLEKPARRIEVYGDSVSAGEVSEAVAYTGKEDPLHEGEYSNSWYSYAWMTARKLHAQIHDIAQGGIALMDGTGWFNDPQFIGMESVWDRVHYNPQHGKATAWDFRAYVPHVVIVALGQNDSHPHDYMQEDDTCQKADVWRAHYASFLKKIRAAYPDAHIVCCTTLLNHDAAWDASIEQVCRGMQDAKITHYMFRRNGSGTPGHLRIQEAEEMADELSAYISGLSIQGWE